MNESTQGPTPQDGAKRGKSDGPGDDSVYLLAENGNNISLGFRCTPGDEVGMQVAVMGEGWATPNKVLGRSALLSYGEADELELVDREDTPFANGHGPETTDWEWYDVNGGEGE